MAIQLSMVALRIPPEVTSSHLSVGGLPRNLKSRNPPRLPVMNVLFPCELKALRHPLEGPGLYVNPLRQL